MSLKIPDRCSSSAYNACVYVLLVWSLTGQLHYRMHFGKLGSDVTQPAVHEWDAFYRGVFFNRTDAQQYFELFNPLSWSPANDPHVRAVRHCIVAKPPPSVVAVTKASCLLWIA